MVSQAVSWHGIKSDKVKVVGSPQFFYYRKVGSTLDRTGFEEKSMVLTKSRKLFAIHALQSVYSRMKSCLLSN